MTFEPSAALATSRDQATIVVALVPSDGAALTVGGELDEVAMNVAFARNGAGVHWRSDAVNSQRLGEEVAICMLEEQQAAYYDDVQLSFTRFDGARITI